MTKEAMEPVAWMYEHPQSETELRAIRPGPGDVWFPGHTEHPLYTAAQLQEAREEERAACAELREAVMTVLTAVRAYLPPDGIDANEALSAIIGAVDNPRINPVIAAIEAGEHREVGK